MAGEGELSGLCREVSLLVPWVICRVYAGSAHSGFRFVFFFGLRWRLDIEEKVLTFCGVWEVLDLKTLSNFEI